MAIICDVCGARVGEGRSKAMVLNDNTDRWFHLCKTCERCIISYTIKDLPKIRKEYLPLPEEKRNAYIEAGLNDGTRANELCNDLNEVLEQYGLRLFTLIADGNYNPAGDNDIIAVIQTIPYLNELPHLDSSVTG